MSHDPIFGCDAEYTEVADCGNILTGTKARCPIPCIADSITAFLATDRPEAQYCHLKCALYRASDQKLIAVTEEKYLLLQPEPDGYAWITFNFPEPKPQLDPVDYYIVVLGELDPSPLVGRTTSAVPSYKFVVQYGVTYPNFPDPADLYEYDGAASIYCSYTPLYEPVAAIKGGTDGYIYIPNLPNLKTVRIEFWCSDVNPSRMQGDQTGGTSPYATLAHWSDGKVDTRDISLISSKYGLNEGDPDWEYMADCVPDRTINIRDTSTASNNNGQTDGLYSTDLTDIYVVFDTGETIYPDQFGYISIPSGATSLTVYRGDTTIMALVTFFEEEIITRLTLNTDKTLGYVGDTFIFYGTFTKYGTPASGSTVTLYKNDVSTGLTDVTDAEGNYSISWVANEVGEYSFYTEVIW